MKPARDSNAATEKHDSEETIGSQDQSFRSSSAVADGLRDVLGPDVLAAIQVGDGPGHLADLVMGTCAETQFQHSLLEQQLTPGIELAELLQLLVRHVRIGQDLASAKATFLHLPGRRDGRPQRLGVDLSRFGPQLTEGHGGNVDVNVDPVHERPGDLGQIAGDLSRRALAGPKIAAEVSAWTGIHGRHEHELGGEVDRLFARETTT